MFGYLSDFNPYYLKLIQLAKYHEDFTERACKFKYQLQSENDLVHLREKYQLEAVAGATDEINQWKNLSRWLNNRHPHGNVESPNHCNARSVLKLSEDHLVTMNCYVLATVLNEMFLSLGFHSRRVHCRPYDAYDLDSHVVTIVYSKIYQKWLFFDPSWNCFVTDDKGIILSLEQFRERLANNLPVWVNGESHETEWSTFYKGYMAKNMFWFSCPIEEGSREREETSYCLLLPEYFLPIDLSKKFPTNVELVICRNPRNFWIEPLSDEQ